MYVCKHVFMYLCTYVCTYGCRYVNKHICIYIYVCICLCASTYICMYIRMYLLAWTMHPGTSEAYRFARPQSSVASRGCALLPAAGLGSILKHRIRYEKSILQYNLG